MQNKIKYLITAFFLISALDVFNLLGTYFLHALQLESVLIAIIAYEVCPKEQYKAKAVLMALGCYSFYVFIVSFLPTSPPTWQYALEVVLFFCITYFQCVKSYSSNQEYNKENVLIAFYKPKNIFDVFFSLFGGNASSMSIIAGENWYMFRRKKDSLQKEHTNYTLLKNKYTVIDTGVKIDKNIIKELNALVGSKVRTYATFYFRFNCVIVFKSFLNKLGKKWSVRNFDIIPAIYLIRRM